MHVNVSNVGGPRVHLSIAKEMWIYIASTVVLTAITWATWIWYDRRFRREHEKAEKVAVGIKCMSGDALVIV